MRLPSPVAGITDIETAAQAASALRPLAGDFAYILFAPAMPLMVVILPPVSKPSVMGAFTAGRSIIILGGIATAAMGVAAVRMFIPG